MSTNENSINAQRSTSMAMNSHSLKLQFPYFLDTHYLYFEKYTYTSILPLKFCTNTFKYRWVHRSAINNTDKISRKETILKTFNVSIAMVFMPLPAEHLSGLQVVRFPPGRGPLVNGARHAPDCQSHTQVPTGCRAGDPHPPAPRQPDADSINASLTTTKKIIVAMDILAFVQVHMSHMCKLTHQIHLPQRQIS